jgi:hypothetical protein
MTDEMDDELWEVTLAEFDEWLGKMNTRELQKEAARAPCKQITIAFINLTKKHTIIVTYGIKQLLNIMYGNMVACLVK